MIIDNDITKVDLKGKYYSFLSKEMDFGDELELEDITNPSLSYIEDWELYTITEKNGDLIPHIVIKSTVTYNVYLGSTQVTKVNKNDILSDGGSASFDTATNTLTLNNSVIPGVYENNSITYKIFSQSDLNLKGSYSMNEAEADIGVYAFNNLTFDGDFTIPGNSYAAYANYGITINSGSLKATGGGGSWWGINVPDGNLTVNNEVNTLDITGTNSSVFAKDIILGDKVVIAEPEGSQKSSFSDHYFLDDGNGNFCKRTILRGSTYVAPTEPPTEASTETTVPEETVGPTDPPVDPELEGEGSDESPFLINNEDEWNRLSSYISCGGTTAGYYYKLKNSFSVSTVFGTKFTCFSGTFDGDNNTLTLNLRSGTYCCAPFSNINGATIKNLKTDGEVVSRTRHNSGLVGAVSGGENLIENCVVSADIWANGYCGGFVGHGGSKGKTTLKNCVFKGDIIAVGHAGTFWGWSDAGSSAELINCFDISDCGHPVGQGSSDPILLTNVYYTDRYKTGGSGRPWTNKGKLAYKVNAEGMTLSGSTGLVYEGTIYAAEKEVINLTAPDNSTLYTSSDGKLYQSGSDLVLTMPDDKVTITRSDAQLYTESKNGTSEAGNENEGASNLVDYDTSTKWCVSNTSFPFSMTFKTEDKVNVHGYTLITANDTETNPGRNPVSWTLEGSNDGTSWTTLTNVSDNYTLKSENFKPYTFRLTNPSLATFSHFRFTINRVSEGKTFQLSEFQLLVGEAPAEQYNLWLGSTRVNSANKKDILGDGGKAQYDPETGTLTLSDPTISSNYKKHDDDTDDYRIYSSGIDLTVEGSYKMPDGNCQYGICAKNGSLTLSGEFSFTGILYGCLSDSITINSGTVRVQGTKSSMEDEVFGIGAYAEKGKITVTNGAEELDAYGCYNALKAKTGFDFGSKHNILAPEDPQIVCEYDNYYIYTQSPWFPADHVKLVNTIAYDLWLGDTRATLKNKNDILGDGGSAKYDPETHTLTLNNPNIGDGYHERAFDDPCLLYANGMNLTIKGKANLIGEFYHNYGVCVDNGSLTLDGDFNIHGDMYGIYATGNINLESGNIKLSGNYREGLLTNDTLNVKNDVEKLTVSGSGKAIYAKNGIVLSSDMKVTTPENGSAEYDSSDSCYRIYNSNNERVSSAVIENTLAYNIWLGSKQVTYGNHRDILGDGKASYDPETNTLTLNNPEITDYYTDSNELTSQIYAQDIDLNIEGSYQSTGDDSSYGIFADNSSLTLNGDFTIKGVVNGIYSKNITFSSGNINVKSIDSNAIKCTGNLIIGDNIESFEAVSENDCAYSADGEVELSSKLYVSEPEFGEDLNNNTSKITIEVAPVYDVAFISNGHGITPDPQKVKRGGKVEVPAGQLERGYIFSGWYIDEGLETPYDFDTRVTGDLTLYAKWTKREYNVYFNSNGYGKEVETQSVKYLENAVEPDKPTETGYTFGGWFTDKELQYPFDFTTGITENTLLYAKWTVNEYEITFNSNGGSGAIDSVKAKHGDTFELPGCSFTAPEGKRFNGWEQGKPGTKITITGNTELMALWIDLPTEVPTTLPATEPTTAEPTTEPSQPTIAEPTSEATAAQPTTEATTAEVTTEPSTAAPSTEATEPTTSKPTEEPSTAPPTTEPTTAEPTTEQASTQPATAAPDKGENKAAVDKKIKALKDDKDVKGSKYITLSSRQANVKSNSITLKWNKVKGAKNYIIYGNKCGKKFRYKQIAVVKKTSFVHNKLKKGTYYKYIIAAFDKNDKLISICKTLHICTKGSKNGNFGKITTAAKKDKVKLQKKDQTFKLKAKAVPQSKKIKVKVHRKLSYESSNTKIAKVNKNGKITAKKKGTCYIYIYAQNGIFKKIKVTVKK